MGWAASDELSLPHRRLGLDGREPWQAGHVLSVFPILKRPRPPEASSHPCRKNHVLFPIPVPPLNAIPGPVESGSSLPLCLFRAYPPISSPSLPNILLPYKVVYIRTRGRYLQTSSSNHHKFGYELPTPLRLDPLLHTAYAVLLVVARWVTSYPKYRERQLSKWFSVPTAGRASPARSTWSDIYQAVRDTPQLQSLLR